MLKNLALRTAALAIAMVIGQAYAADTKPIDVPPGELTLALETLAKQSGVEFVYEVQQLKGLQTKGVHGELTPEHAVAKLLEGTKLVVTMHQSGAVLIAAPQASSAAASAEPTKLRLANSESQSDTTQGSTEGQNTTNTENQKSDPSSDGSGNKLQEIVVTAQKKEERSQDVPVPVTVISAQSLIDNGQMRLQDYFTSMPGLNVQPFSPTSQLISIRGITTGAGNPTVGIVVDDVPYGSSTGYGAGLFVPDFDPGDLARVEELRGPQGTLYGVSSLSGLLKFVTVDPSADTFTGRLQLGTTSVRNGDGLGYSLRGSVNAPITEALAVRASAFTRLDPGYIDNPTLGRRGVNEQRVSGGHLAALWRASDLFSLKLSALLQDFRGDGVTDIDSRNGLDNLKQNTIAGTGAFERKVQAYSAIASAKLGRGDFTSLTGYNINEYSASADLTPALGRITQFGFALFGVPATGVPGTETVAANRITTFSQELRYATSIGEHFDWLLGAFYMRERSPGTSRLIALNDTGAPVAGLAYLSNGSIYDERAAFTNLTLHATQRFDLQLGARQSDIRQTYDAQTIAGPFTPLLALGRPSPVTIAEQHSKNHAFTYLVTPQFKISPGLMAYARFASGYRPGGPNNPAVGLVPTYQPDKTENYDLGIKGNVLSHALSFDASLYYIDWKRIQYSLSSQGFLAYIDNAGKAKSQGVELSLEARPARGMRIATWVAWTDAKLTEAIPPNSSAFGPSGERLPLTSRFSGTLSVDQDFPLAAGFTGFAGGTVSYVGERLGGFAIASDPQHQRQAYPSYAKVDLRAGARSESWTANLFVANVTDKRGILYGGLSGFPRYAFQVIQPRTVGVQLAYSWR